MSKPAIKKLYQTAKKHGVPLQQSEELTELLSKIELKDLPDELFVTLAGALEIIFKLNNEKERAIKNKQH